MGSYSFKLPDLGEGIVESEVSTWYVQVGDSVEEDQSLADVQTDKAIVEVTSPVQGKVIALGCAAGDVLAVGAELVCFEIEGEGETAVNQAIAEPASVRTETAIAAPLAEPVAPAAVVKQSTTGSSGSVRASPSLRRRAR
jgi:2-oxoisovalerate dehydrogenase E2 component (dihydrolipoyl transacylase)